MKAITRRGLLAGFGVLALVGVAGCPADNADEAKDANKTALDGKKAEAAKKEDAPLPPPKDQKEAYERSKNLQKNQGTKK